MDTSYFTFHTLSQFVALLTAAYLLRVGTWSFTSPIAMSKAYGAPQSPPINPFVHAFAARVFALGLITPIFAWLGKWSAVGIVMSTFPICAAVGSWIDAKHGGRRWKKASKMHMLPTMICVHCIVELNWI